MRHFVYFSSKARTSGNWKDLMSAGRMDIVCNVIIHTFFLSNKMRDDVHLHLIFNGAPNPPMHLEFISNKDMPISKKDVGGLIKRMLYKCKNAGKSSKDDSGHKKTEVFPGCFIEKKSFRKLLNEFETDGKKIRVLDSKGKNLRDVKDLQDCVFVIGDHEGLPRKEVKRYDKISIGKKTYFASQTFVVLNHELDIRGV